MQAYSSEQVQTALADPAVSGWQLDPVTGEVFKEYKFKNFVGSIAFVVHLAAVAEEIGHHPDILIRYNRVRLGVFTHDADNGLTDLDFKLAARANGEFNRDRQN